MRRTKSLHPIGSGIQALRQATQRAVNKMVRERDKELGCITCGAKGELDAGHFVSVGARPNLRFHPFNINGQCRSDNGYKGGMGWEYGKALNEKYGTGTDTFLKTVHSTQLIGEAELEVLKDAARRGWRVYTQVYREMFPSHFPKQ